LRSEGEMSWQLEVKVKGDDGAGLEIWGTLVGKGGPALPHASFASPKGHLWRKLRHQPQPPPDLPGAMTTRSQVAPVTPGSSDLQHLPLLSP
jgi:hypothetical protein